MNPTDIQHAALEAQRFQDALAAWRAKDKELEEAYQAVRKANPTKDYVYRGSANVEHAALKRASMDLTRALARMRKSS